MPQSAKAPLSHRKIAVFYHVGKGVSGKHCFSFSAVTNNAAPRPERDVVGASLKSDVLHPVCVAIVQLPGRFVKEFEALGRKKEVFWLGRLTFEGQGKNVTSFDVKPKESVSFSQARKFRGLGSILEVFASRHLEKLGITHAGTTSGPRTPRITQVERGGGKPCVSYPINGERFTCALTCGPRARQPSNLLKLFFQPSAGCENSNES